jgi:MFS transporter, PHS family, inorganic phosphate transporter
MVGYVYYPTTGVLPSSSDTAIKISTSAGTVIGQLGFGFLADHLGRKKVSLQMIDF